MKKLVCVLVMVLTIMLLVSCGITKSEAKTMPNEEIVISYLIKYFKMTYAENNIEISCSYDETTDMIDYIVRKNGCLFDIGSVDRSYAISIIN